MKDIENILHHVSIAGESTEQFMIPCSKLQYLCPNTYQRASAQIIRPVQRRRKKREQKKNACPGLIGGCGIEVINKLSPRWASGMRSASGRPGPMHIHCSLSACIMRTIIEMADCLSPRPIRLLTGLHCDVAKRSLINGALVKCACLELAQKSSSQWRVLTMVTDQCWRFMIEAQLPNFKNLQGREIYFVVWEIEIEHLNPVRELPALWRRGLQCRQVFLSRLKEFGL